MLRNVTFIPRYLSVSKEPTQNEIPWYQSKINKVVLENVKHLKQKKNKKKKKKLRESELSANIFK